MTYPVASLTVDSARSYVMHGTPFTQGTISIIPIGGNISLEGFLLPILLLVMIIVTVVIVAVILVVVIVAIVGVVIVVTIIGVVVVIGVFAIIKLTFMIIVRGHYLLVKSLFNSVQAILSACSIPIVRHKVANFWNLLIMRTLLIGQEPFQFSPGDLVGLLYSNRFGIGIPPGQGILGESNSSKFYFAVLGVSLGLVVLSVFAMLAACASRAVETLSATSFLMSS
nr:hypothetical protein [Tanacetum cinerariifolium]